METRTELSPRIDEATSPEHSNKLAAPLEIAKQLYKINQELKDRHDLSIVEKEAIRGGVLGELFEVNAHEMVGDVVYSLARLYEDRTIEYRDDDKGATVRIFATRDATNEWLDDHFELTSYDNGDFAIEVSCLEPRPPHANADDYLPKKPVDLGFAVQAYNDNVHTSQIRGAYRIPTSVDEKTTDGSLNKHHMILREFYSRALATAGFVLDRLKNDPVAAAEANQQVKEMLRAELSLDT